jgi:hypothetical protein
MRTCRLFCINWLRLRQNTTNKTATTLAHLHEGHRGALQQGRGSADQRQADSIRLRTEFGQAVYRGRVHQSTAIDLVERSTVRLTER